MQRCFHTIDHQRVASVVSTLKTHNPRCGLCEPIDQFTLAFISPLGTNDNDVTTFADLHVYFFKVKNGEDRERPTCLQRARVHGRS